MVAREALGGGGSLSRRTGAGDVGSDMSECREGGVEGGVVEVLLAKVGCYVRKDGGGLEEWYVCVRSCISKGLRSIDH